MKPTEIRLMTDDELLAREAELERAVFNLKIQKATGQLENTARLAETRRDLARIKTIIREKGLNLPAATAAKAPAANAPAK
jgi:large subunit ribosomal protein L29